MLALRGYIIGQDEIIEQMLIAMFARGHCLTIGGPGLAKTLTIATLGQALHLKFRRIQLTPDLKPSDITGTEIVEEERQTGRRVLRFVRGPIFSNIVLADEINRAPPKTQSALLQAMQEYQVTVAGRTYDLDNPFFVMATQNPLEQEGTYPLPEAQLDRFMLSIKLNYPNKQEECQIVNATTQDASPNVRQVLRSRDILGIQKLVRQIPATEHIVEYAVDLARATRPNEPESPNFVKQLLASGAGPRAAQHLITFMERMYDLLVGHDLLARELDETYIEGYRDVITQLVNRAAETMGIDEVVDRLKRPEPADGLDQLITFDGTNVQLQREGYSAVVRILARLSYHEPLDFVNTLRSEVLGVCSELGLPIPPVGAGVADNVSADSVGPDGIQTQAWWL